MSASDSIGQRFTQLIQHLGMSKNAFAQSLDKTATVIQHLVDERNKPGYDLLCKVFDTYPNVSKDWLMLGQGPMLLTSAAPEVSAAPAPEASAPAAPPAETFEPLLPPPLRRRATDEGALLQPADIAATVALAAAYAPKPVAAASMPAAAAPAPDGPAPLPATVPSVSAAPTSPLPLPAAVPTPAALPDPAYLTAALQTQYLQHQLALAEQRNQHLVEQQALMQQMVALLQRAI